MIQADIRHVEIDVSYFSPQLLFTLLSISSCNSMPRLISASWLAVLVTIVILPHTSTAQNSPFLQDPDLFLPYVKESADFWRGVHDPANGGFFTNVSREGQLITSRGTNKDVLSQSRNLYAMVRAFQLTGDESYLDLAWSTFDFMTEHGWDETYGGWFNALSTNGSVQNVNAQKTAFIQHYAVLGPLALAEATDDSTAWLWVNKSMDYLNDVLWDPTPGREGYYDWVSRTGSFRTAKSFNATVDALTTHALTLWMLTDEEAYRVRLNELADNILDRLVPSMDDQAIGFAEKYDTNWGVVADERTTIMGHVLKTGWVLGRMNELLPDPRLLEGAQTLVDHVMANGYDHEFGGPYKDYDRLTGEMHLYGLADTTKAWWQMEQAFTAGMALYRETRQQEYLDMAAGTVDFYMEHFVDPVYGEVYADRTRRGDDIPQWGDTKGDGYKAAYHSVEFGWYGYLYGHLILNFTPATVYYRIQEQDADRVIRLAPIEWQDDYAIGTVVHDGQTWNGITNDGRSLDIPAGTGGLFEVTFYPRGLVATESLQPIETNLTGIWPNPARHQATVGFDMALPGPASWTLVDALGRSVQSGSSTWLQMGSHTWSVDTSQLASGVYTIVVTHQKGREAASLVVLN